VKDHEYAIYDVFTETRLAGNPLAVVFDCGGMDEKAMQRVAGEFNLSETAFVLPAESPHHSAAVRIFTPRHELPFAGHPTVGTAVAIAEREAGRHSNEQTAIVVLEERVGAVRCAVTVGGEISFAEFDLPKLPQALPLEAGPEAVAAALGLSHHEIGFENHVVGAWTAGVPYVCVPVAGLDVAGRVNMNAELWRQIGPVVGGVLAEPYVYCRETVNHDCAFHARMFAPDSGIAEDPATGSAAAAFAGAVVRFDQPVDGSHGFWIEQGIEMGRPSRIRVELDVEKGSCSGARLGGHAVRLAAGKLHL
jgi:trans-2,3-dihydro-3-hydroxyanthranilate isomerase